MYNQLLAILFETKKKGLRSMQVIFLSECFEMGHFEYLMFHFL